MELTDRIRQILRGRGLSLSRISAESANLFGLRSRYYVSEKMYYEISALDGCPSIHQFTSLSRITGYKLNDWLEVFDIRLDDIPRLQLLLSRKNTVLLDASVYDEDSPVAWFVERHNVKQIGAITPLGRYLARGPDTSIANLLALGSRKFSYAKVGDDDVYAFPEIAPGSLVRVDGHAAAHALSSVGSACSKQVFLVTNGPKLHCGHLRRERNGRLVLCSNYFPFSHVELGSADHVSVVGVVDAELRIVRDPTVPSPASRPPEREKQIEIFTDRTRLNTLLHAARRRAGLSLQDASKTSRSIASQLGNSRYFAASGTLSDYENHRAVPRSVHKIVSLCVLYSIGFWDFLQAADLPIQLLGRDRILTTRSNIPTHPLDKGSKIKMVSSDAFFTGLIDRWQQIPLFVRNALDTAFALKHVSLSDIYWVQDHPAPLHPLLVNASFIVVNRRMKKPPGPTRKTLWEQPLHLVLKRDGEYLCGCCTLQGGTVTIHSRPFNHQSALPLRDGIDAEVIGQVTAILRRIP